MTDMKISDGAVEAMLRTSPLYLDMGPGGTYAHKKKRISDSFAEALSAALTYYAAHPDELPQDVRDAVMGKPRQDRSAAICYSTTA